MSYAFNIYFSPANSLAEALELANRFMMEIKKPENVKEYINKRILFDCPAVKKPISRLSPYAMEHWVRSTTSFHFIYWKDYKLVGLISDRMNAAEKVFEKFVYFQNTASQAYPLKTWDGIAPFFDRIYNKWNGRIGVSDLKFAIGEELDEGTIDKDFEKLRKVAAYKDVFSLLHLSDWLNGEPYEGVHTFSMGMVTSPSSAYPFMEYTRERLTNLGITKDLEERQKQKDNRTVTPVIPMGEEVYVVDKRIKRAFTGKIVELDKDVIFKGKVKGFTAIYNDNQPIDITYLVWAKEYEADFDAPYKMFQKTLPEIHLTAGILPGYL